MRLPPERWSTLVAARKRWQATSYGRACQQVLERKLVGLSELLAVKQERIRLVLTPPLRRNVAPRRNFLYREGATSNFSVRENKPTAKGHRALHPTLLSIYRTSRKRSMRKVSHAGTYHRRYGMGDLAFAEVIQRIKLLLPDAESIPIPVPPFPPSPPVSV